MRQLLRVIAGPPSRLELLLRRMLARAMHRPFVEFKRLTDWPSPSADGWQGPAATSRYEAGFNGPTAFESIEAGDAVLESPVVRELIAGLERIPLASADVLDFGCSNGRYCLALRQSPHTAQWRYTGVDINARLIDECRARMPWARFHVADGDARLPFEDDMFDVVIGNGVLLHVAEPPLLLSEFKRISRGWVMLGRVPVREDSPGLMYLHRIWYNGHYESHAMHVFNHSELLRLFEGAGLELVWSGQNSERYRIPGEDEPVQHMLFLLRCS